MNTLTRARRRLSSIVLAAAVLTFAATAQSDPPSRAARIGYMQGPVSFAPAGDDNWVEARLNRPITVGDGLWTDNNARTELQFGAATVRLDEYTSVQLLNLDDRTIQLQLSQGRLNIHARDMRKGEVVEIATPNIAFTFRTAGDYRIDVDPSDNATTVSVRRGSGEVYGDGGAFTLRRGDVVRFVGRDLGQREFFSLAPVDDFDRWGFERDRRGERSLSARYVSSEVVGYADLDQHGSWRSEESFGNVWFPREVARDWAPYRNGHWSWIDPWGWSWVDDAPWGFAPFHYGRWATFGGRWGWVPGPINVRPVYAPALVAFIGGSNFQISVSSGPVAGGIGWFPLGPGEVYRPAYNASRDYVRNVNVSNTVVNTTVINNIYNNQTNVTQVNYRNVQVANAVTAVPPAVFAQSQSVQRSMVAVSQEQLRGGQVTTMAAVAPTPMGMAGGASATSRKPSRAIVEREVVARTAPAATIAPVAQRIDLLQRNPGQPLERSAITAKTPSPAVANVRVVEQQAPQAVPQGTPRGMGAPPGMQQRTAAEPARPTPQAGGVIAPPAALPATPTAAAPAQSLQPRERGRGGQENPQGNRSTPAPGVTSSPSPAPSASAVAPPPQPPRAAVAPTPGVTTAPAAPETRQRNQGPPQRNAAPREAMPQPQPQSSAPAALAPVQMQRQAPAAAAPVPAPQAAPAAPAPAPAQRAAPAAAAPAPAQRAAPAAAAPVPAPQAAPAAVAPVPAPRNAPAAAPATPPQASVPAPAGGNQEVRRQGRGNPNDNQKDDDKKDKK